MRLSHEEWSCVRSKENIMQKGIDHGRIKSIIQTVFVIHPANQKAEKTVTHYSNNESDGVENNPCSYMEHTDLVDHNSAEQEYVSNKLFPRKTDISMPESS